MFDELAWQTDKGIVLASSLIASLRRQRLLLPTVNVIERICAEAITRANRRIDAALTDPLSDEHRQRLDELLKRRDGGKAARLAWLRQSAVKPNARHMRDHIESLKAWQTLDLPAGIDRAVHHKRQVQAAEALGRYLAYFKFRFLKGPREGLPMCSRTQANML